MIKKLLLICLCGLLSYSIWLGATKGLEVGKFKVYSYNDLINNNETLNRKIEQLNKLNEDSFTSVTKKLQSVQNEFDQRKELYEETALLATEEEIAEANQREEYLLDLLWIKIGNYANANNIKILMSPIENSTSIKFDVTGAYISIINFIYDIENDDELAFTVDNIIMQGASSDLTTKATFTVTGVNIVTAESE